MSASFFYAQTLKIEMTASLYIVTNINIMYTLIDKSFSLLHNESL